MAGCSASNQQASSEPSATASPAPKENAMTQITPPASAKPAAFTHIVQADADYYLSGPQQGRPSEGKLSAGTKVSVGEDKMGQYVFVESETGIKAWVHEDALKALE